MKKIILGIAILSTFGFANIEICPISVNEDAIQISDKAFDFYLKKDIKNAVQYYEEAKSKLENISLAYECSNAYLINEFGSRVDKLKIGVDLDINS